MPQAPQQHQHQQEGSRGGRHGGRGARESYRGRGGYAARSNSRGGGNRQQARGRGAAPSSPNAESELKLAFSNLKTLVKYAPLSVELLDDQVIPLLQNPARPQHDDETFVIQLVARAIDEGVQLSPSFRNATLRWPPLSRWLTDVDLSDANLAAAVKKIVADVVASVELYQLDLHVVFAFFTFACKHYPETHALRVTITEAKAWLQRSVAPPVAPRGHTSMAPPRAQQEVFPMNQELLANPGEILRNLPILTDEPIANLNQHIDNVFALTREDFMLPLREGVLAARNQVQGVTFHTQEERDRQRKRQLQAYAYDDVTYKGHGITPQDGLVFGFQAAQRPAGQRPIPFAKRLMNGNLVIITAWKGKDTPIGEQSVFGVVVRRRFQMRPGHRFQREDPIHRGLFDVCFNDSHSQQPRYAVSELMTFFNASRRFHFIESKAFFLPIYRVLSQLKSLDIAQLDALAPALRSGNISAYGLAPFINVDGVVQRKARAGTGTTLNVQQPFEGIRAESQAVFADWTSELEDRLSDQHLVHVVDHTQRDALALAFSSNVPLIQGTPGTGKTFIGGKIVQLLLKNRVIKEGSPMLVLALTQHALDSFTLDLLQIEDPQFIIRIGAASQNPIIRNANLGFDFKMNKVWRRPPPEAVEAKLHDLSKWLHDVKTHGVSDGKLEHYTGSTHSFLPQAWKDYLRVHVLEYGTRVLQSVADKLKRIDANIKQHEGTIARRPALERSKRQLQDRIRKTTCSRAALGELAHELRRLQRITPLVPRHGGMRWQHYALAFNSILTEATRACQERYEEVQAALQLPAQLADIEATLQDISTQETVTLPHLREQARLHKVLFDAVSVGRYHFWRNALGTYQPPQAATRSMPRSVVVTRGPAPNDDDSGLDEDDSDLSAVDTVEDYDAQRDADERAVLDHLHGAKEEDATEFHLDLDPAAVQRAQRWFQTTDATTLPTTAEARHTVNEHLIVLVRDDLNKQMEKLVEEVDKVRRQNAMKEDDEKVKVLRQHRIITATTTGAALVLPLLHRCNIPIVMIEEAAEVPESHVLACLPRSTRQLLLIGDPRQLPPKVNDTRLATRHGLEMSLMERLQKLGVRHVTLTTQRRMHPSISNFVKAYYLETEGQQIYDHPSTHKRQRVSGMRDGVGHFCWLDSRGSSDAMSPGMQSPFNDYEAALALLVASYLAYHVKRENVVIITPYKGQLMRLIELCKEQQLAWSGRTEEGKVRLATIDDYQGEECDVVILTLVRTAEPGFLRKDNRACVALSRAKRFLCIIGSSTVIPQANKIWGDALKRCQNDKVVFNAFPGFCTQHSKEMNFSNPREYRASVNVNGGCMTRCGQRLSCGHDCRLDCHVETEETNHTTIRCLRVCGRVGPACGPPRPCSHPCVSRCCDACAQCVVKIPNVLLSCQVHHAEVLCHQLPPHGVLPNCTAPVTRLLNCGHEFTAPCHEWPRDGELVSEALQRKCRAKCAAQMPCGHVCWRTCHWSEDDDHQEGVTLCNRPTQTDRPCGHGVALHNCNQPLHPCTAPCGTLRPCGHPCVQTCDHDGSCDDYCCDVEVDFVHPKCRHRGTKICSESASDVICMAPCGVMLACGHPCQGTCSSCRTGASGATWFAHPPCMHETPRGLPCGHDCKACSQPNLPCAEPCMRRCPHQECSRHECGACKAVECKEKCKWQCKHHTCTKLCFEACDRGPCHENCEEKLPCGHWCHGCCGEPCPTVCLTCAAQSGELPKNLRHMFTLVSSDEELMAYCKDGTLPDELMEDENFEPWHMQLIELRCTCVFFRYELDQHVLLRSSRGGEVHVIACPHCRSPILPGDVLLYHTQLTNNQRVIHAVRQRRQQETSNLQQQYAAEAENVRTLVRNVLEAFSANAELLALWGVPISKPKPKPTLPVRQSNADRAALRDIRKQYEEQLGKWEREENARQSQLGELRRVRSDAVARLFVRNASFVYSFIEAAETLQWKLQLGDKDQTYVTVPPSLLGAFAALLKEWQHTLKLLKNNQNVGELQLQLCRVDPLLRQPDLPTAEQFKLMAQHMLRVGMLARCQALMPAARRLQQAAMDRHRGQGLLPWAPAHPKSEAILQRLQPLFDTAIAAADVMVQRAMPGAFFVENPCLRRNCAALRRFVNGVAKLIGEGDVVHTDVVLGYHGTAMENVSTILCQGFDPTKRAGQALGPGEYFAQTMTTSLSYARGSQFMLVNLILRASQHRQLGDVLVVNNPVNEPHVQFQVPLGVAIYGQADKCGHADYDRCCTLTTDGAIVERVTRLQTFIRRACDDPATLFSDQRADVELRELEKACAVIPPSRDELRQITAVLGLSAGHAFQCPNGHLYFIADCGGAMMESTCNECGARIGGGSHALRRDNAFAGHLFDDGAAPSWPTMGVHP